MVQWIRLVEDGLKITKKMEDEGAKTGIHTKMNIKIIQLSEVHLMKKKNNKNRSCKSRAMLAWTMPHRDG